jgi:predicted metal-dependent hydrolase
MASRLLIRRAPSAAAVGALPESVLGFPLALERPSRGRRLRLSVATNCVRMVWPQGVAAALAVDFFEQHRAWVESTVRAHRQVEERARAHLALDPRWPGRVPWFGHLLPLHFETGPARLVVTDDALHCRVPAGPSAARAVRRLIVAGLSEGLAARSRGWLADYEPLVGARCQQLRIRPMRSLWGSLSPQGVVSLNLALAFADEALAEYVLVHELAHFRERNHGPRFWAHVTHLCPDHLERRRALNLEHRYLQALLERLQAST